MLNFPDSDEDDGVNGGDRSALSDVRALRQPPPFPNQPGQIAIPPRPNDDLDFGQLWLKVRENYAVVLAVAAAVFFAVMLVTLASKTQFQAIGRLYLGELDGRTGGTGARSGDFDISGGAHGELGSEIEILRSRTLIVQAIQAAGLNVAITPTGEPTSRYWHWLLSRRDPSSLDRAARELRAVDATLAERFREEQRFYVRFTTNDEYELWSEVGQIGNGKLALPFSSPDLKITLLRAPNGQIAAGSRYDLRISPLDRVTERALENLQVTTPKATTTVNVVTLQFTEPSPRMAAAFLEQLMLAYLKERQTWKTEDASAAEAFVGNQLASIRASLDDVQSRLAEFRQNNRVVVLDNEAKAMIERIAKYEEQRVTARMQVAAMADIQRVLKGANPPMGAFMLGEANDPVLEGMANSLSAARQKLTSLDSRFNGAAPDVREQQAQVDAQLAAIRGYVSSRLTRAQESLGALNSIIAQFEEKLKTVPGAELGLAQLSRESEVFSKTYSYLLERQQQAAIIKASQLSKNRVLDLPRVPTREHSPKLLLRLSIGLAGLLFGVALVVMRSLFGGTLQSEADAQRTLGAHPILGSIPRQRHANGFGLAPEWFRIFDLPAAEVGSRFLEAFRALRANLYRWGSGAGRGRVVLFSSPNPGDGKTTCANWLAAALAADGRRVLLIDADLRRPPLPTKDGDLHEPGLRSVLTGEYTWQEVLLRVSEPAEGFCCLPSGGTAPPELLSGQRMADLLNETRTRFDFVLIDAPSFPTYSDALVLASSADTVLSVLRLQTTRRKAAREHVSQLAASASSFAVLVNNAGGSKPARAAAPTRHSGGPGLNDLQDSVAPRRGRLAFWLAAAFAIALAGAFWLSRQGFVT